MHMPFINLWMRKKLEWWWKEGWFYLKLSLIFSFAIHKGVLPKLGFFPMAKPLRGVFHSIVPETDVPWRPLWWERHQVEYGRTGSTISWRSAGCPHILCAYPDGVSRTVAIPYTVCKNVTPATLCPEWSSSHAHKHAFELWWSVK